MALAGVILAVTYVMCVAIVLDYTRHYTNMKWATSIAATLASPVSLGYIVWNDFAHWQKRDHEIIQHQENRKSG